VDAAAFLGASDRRDSTVTCHSEDIERLLAANGVWLSMLPF
jgi:hypothetical protein